jgi:mannosyl-oligosaccharide glucosidase
MHLRITTLLTSLLYATGTLASQDPNDVSVLIKEAARANNESLLWGPYKPNLYFGVRPRIANSLAAGLMWAKVDNFATAQGSMFSLHPVQINAQSLSRVRSAHVY